MMLRDALMKAMKRRQTDKSRADAVMEFLGLDKGDGIVPMDDVAHILAFTKDALDWFSIMGYALDGWDEDDMLTTSECLKTLVALMPQELMEEEEDE